LKVISTAEVQERQLVYRGGGGAENAGPENAGPENEGPSRNMASLCN